MRWDALEQEWDQVRRRRRTLVRVWLFVMVVGLAMAWVSVYVAAAVILAGFVAMIVLDRRYRFRCLACGVPFIGAAELALFEQTHRCPVCETTFEDGAAPRS